MSRKQDPSRGVMFDLETLSTRKDAAIVSIGACRFSPEKGIYDPFYVTIDAKDSKKMGFHFSKDTIEWWETQPKEAREAWQKNGIPVQEAIEKFWNYLKKNEVVYAYGATFDFPIVENAFLKCGLVNPWNYWDCLCARTTSILLDIHPDRTSEGTHHNALDDAKAQARMILEIFK